MNPCLLGFFISPICDSFFWFVCVAGCSGPDLDQLLLLLLQVDEDDRPLIAAADSSYWWAWCGELPTPSSWKPPAHLILSTLLSNFLSYSSLSSYSKSVRSMVMVVQYKSNP
jgi:hypothetical protein